MAKFSLPGSSFDELKKIIQAYGNSKPNDSIGEIASLAGVHRTIVSKNNKFLAELTIIEGGQKKQATDLGRKLARAIEHSMEIDASNAWSQAVSSNEPLSAIMTTVRIKGGMSEQDLTKHILYVSEQTNTQGNRTGARCVLDVLNRSNLLEETDGKFTVASPTEQVVANVEQNAESEPERPTATEDETLPTKNLGQPRIGPNVSINIQVQLPEGQDAEVYERIFAAMKNNLFPSNSNG